MNVFFLLSKLNNPVSPQQTFVSVPSVKCATQLSQRSSLRHWGIWLKALTSTAFILKTVSGTKLPAQITYWDWCLCGNNNSRGSLRLVLIRLVLCPQCGLRTVNRSTPPSWTLTSTWWETRPPASPTLEWLSTSTPTGRLAPPNQRRPGCGTAATGSGRSSISTARAPPPHWPSKNRSV